MLSTRVHLNGVELRPIRVSLTAKIFLDGLRRRLTGRIVLYGQRAVLVSCSTDKKVFALCLSGPESERGLCAIACTAYGSNRKARTSRLFEQNAVRHRSFVDDAIACLAQVILVYGLARSMNQKDNKREFGRTRRNWRGSFDLQWMFMVVLVLWTNLLFAFTLDVLWPNCFRGLNCLSKAIKLHSSLLLATAKKEKFS